tara:strand:+ start:108 stop:1205 length:1098 start_codon:yes stop_codon:yes gene_type:complete
MLNIPYLSNIHYVHLHGLQVSPEVERKLLNESKLLPNKQPVSTIFMGGFTGFLTQHNRFPNWVPYLSHSKHSRFQKRFEGIQSMCMAKALNFIDPFSTGPTKKMYSLQLINPDWLRMIGIECPIPTDDPSELNVYLLDEINITLGLLRILGFKIITPFISSIPYNEFFEYNSSNRIQMVGLDDSEVRRSFTNNERVLNLSDLEWLKENFGWVWNGYINAEIKGTEAFSNAFAMILNNIYAVDETVKFTTAWTGLESLLKPPSVNIGKNMMHRMTYDGLIGKKRAKRLWYYRNKVIHGDLSDELRNKLGDIGDELHALLCSTTKFFIEQKIIPTKENLDERYGEYTEVRCRTCNELLKCYNCEKNK